MDDTEILNYYNLTSLEPAEWPAEKDDDYVSGDESTQPSRHLLERGPSLRECVPGSQRGKDGVHNLVQKDEQDPLGTGSTVMQLLQRQGRRVTDDVRTRNQFLLSSTTFSPSLYLSHAHSDASTEDLLRGLDFLSNSIEQKSASLKHLVESNFERFVKAKATIDNVYSEMRKAGAESEPERLPSPSSMSMRRPRSVSGQTMSLRKGGRPFASPSPTPRIIVEGPRKNALVKDTEYGVQGLRLPLNEASGKAEEIWGPALGGRDREENLKSALTTIDRNRAIFDVGIALEDCIKAHDYGGIAENYTSAHKHAIDAKNISERAKLNGIRVSDSQLQQVLVAARVWMDVRERVNVYKRECQKTLSSVSLSAPSRDMGEDEDLELVSLLLSLGVEDNPITLWLRHRIGYYQARVSTTFERARIELEVARRKLTSSRKPSPKVLASYLGKAGTLHLTEHAGHLDTTPVIAFWEQVWKHLNSLLSAKAGLLREILEFSDTLQSFIDGKRQHTLPMGIDGESRKHHKLDPNVVQELQQGVLQLFTLIQEQVRGLLVEAPIDDVSSLLTSIPQTPATPGSADKSPSKATRFTFKFDDVPSSSPKTGESWEKYAFWPPNSNSLSASIYLQRILSLLAMTAIEIASCGLVEQNSNVLLQVRNLVTEVRERLVTAICAAWLSDSDNCREIEDWSRSRDRRDLTNMPARLSGFETTLLDDLQKIIFLPNVRDTPAASRMITSPPRSIVEVVQRTFKSSLYKTLSTIIEHAAKADVSDEDDDLTIPSTSNFGAGAKEDSADITNTNIRKILTMSNLSHLRSDTLPKLCTHFETSFSVYLTDDLKSLRDTLHQMHSRVFQAYIRPTVDRLRSLITSGIITPSYAPSNPNANPTDARPYVYEVLLTLVLVHAEVSSTAPPLTSQILGTLFEQISAAYLHAFKQRQRYSLATLMQATLDVEFTAQTLNLYTTDKVADVQGQIYMALDERTDNDARLKLQTELPQMRAILKRLREGTRGSFGCFKKERRKEREKGEGKREG